MYNYENNNYQKEKKERRYDFDESCVIVNIFCDDKKKEYKSDDYCKDGYKKEYDKDDKNCVTINIYCDKCKKY
ncbi:hypothetical protein acsn021_01420 [Anaerocolumna cellulosilytica]|uniref:Uncharacterized protein n=1 Tax=Anaerocolumna cellulosilytica TaxID=433286 RepID=A0A6S6QMK0_9FIRM|nr:hypothetical protein [Anaerocolumna cellulosilytica]MBB5196107.1 hypothetical protein [Anaerocolumna cellulosilytica]BCJ92573.1 hypothetical protein acsn021_01420 [Anaerocolumna cellulosilytica]